MEKTFEDAYHVMYGHVEVVDEDVKSYIINVRKVVPKNQIVEFKEHINKRQTEALESKERSTVKAFD